MGLIVTQGLLFQVQKILTIQQSQCGEHHLPMLITRENVISLKCHQKIIVKEQLGLKA